VAWLAGVSTAAFTLLAAVQPTLRVSDQVVDNPVGLAAVGNPEESALGAFLGALLALATVLAVASLVVRFRRSRGEERAQLKWFTSAGLLLPPLFMGDLPGDVVPAVVSDLSTATIVLLPVAAGVAILRYRLYEIDRLLNRTLVYGLVTVLLAGVYAGLVLLLGQLSGGVADGTPSWVVAGATLAVAALFQPARRRIQAVVDQTVQPTRASLWLRS
jgi:hypothetical protein